MTGKFTVNIQAIWEQQAEEGKAYPETQTKLLEDRLKQLQKMVKTTDGVC